jgi:hypothetical protein
MVLRSGMMGSRSGRLERVVGLISVLSACFTAAQDPGAASGYSFNRWAEFW